MTTRTQSKNLMNKQNAWYCKQGVGRIKCNNNKNEHKQDTKSKPVLVAPKVHINRPGWGVRVGRGWK